MFIKCLEWGIGLMMMYDGWPAFLAWVATAYLLTKWVEGMDI